MSRRLVVLRPEPGASATAARAATLGFDPVVAPLFGIVAVGWSPPDAGGFDAMLLTSANAVRHGGSALQGYVHLPAFAVGAATAKAARAAGFGQVTSGDADGAALLAQAVAGGTRRLLHLAGRDHRPLDHPGATIVRCIVYAAEPIGVLPAPAQEALAAGATALLHSPRAAATLRRLIDGSSIQASQVRIAAISAAALDAAGPGWGAAIHATVPTNDALLAAAARLCD